MRRASGGPGDGASDGDATAGQVRRPQQHHQSGLSLSLWPYTGVECRFWGQSGDRHMNGQRAPLLTVIHQTEIHL
jgi:hypothetical protein